MSGFGKSPDSSELSDVLGSSIKTHAVPFSHLAVSEYFKELLESIDYDEISTAIVNDKEFVTFKQAGAIVKQIEIEYDGAQYIIRGDVTVEFIGLEDGTSDLLQENGDELIVA